MPRKHRKNRRQLRIRQQPKVRHGPGIMRRRRFIEIHKRTQAKKKAPRRIQNNRNLQTNPKRFGILAQQKNNSQRHENFEYFPA